MSQQGRTRSGSVVFPLLLIALGTLFLLWRWLPDFDPFPVLWKYWPLFLILVGAGMLWDRMQRHRDPQTAPSFPVGSMIGTLLFLIVLTVLLWHHHSTHRLHWTNWDIVSTGSSSHDKMAAPDQNMKEAIPASRIRATLTIREYIRLRTPDSAYPVGAGPSIKHWRPIESCFRQVFLVRPA